jgi:hypothetical protein
LADVVTTSELDGVFKECMRSRQRRYNGNSSICGSSAVPRDEMLKYEFMAASDKDVHP